LENDKINTEGKEDVIKELLKNINKKKDININEYIEDLECIDNGEYAELIWDLDKIGQRSLSIIVTVILTLIWRSYLQQKYKK